MSDPVHEFLNKLSEASGPKMTREQVERMTDGDQQMLQDRLTVLVEFAEMVCPIIHGIVLGVPVNEACRRRAAEACCFIATAPVKLNKTHKNIADKRTAESN